MLRVPAYSTMMIGTWIGIEREPITPSSNLPTSDNVPITHGADLRAGLCFSHGDDRIRSVKGNVH